MTRQAAQGGFPLNIPNQYPSVVTARSEAPAVGGEGDTANRPTAGRDHVAHLTRVRLPDPHRAVIPARSDERAVGRRGHLPDGAFVPAKNEAQRGADAQR